MAFQKMLSRDDTYVPVESIAETENFTLEDEVEELEKVEEKYHKEITPEEKALSQEDFMIDEMKFFVPKTSRENVEGEITAKETAKIGVEALKALNPELNLEEKLNIYLATLPGTTKDFWNIMSLEDTHAWMCIHPVSGEVLCILWPHRDPVYNGYTDEGYTTPWMSLSDFYGYMNTDRWLSKAIAQVRSLGLNGEESIVQYDKETGISFDMNGCVSVPLLIGNGGDAQHIRIYLDLYTSDYVGYMLYDKIYGIIE